MMKVKMKARVGLWKRNILNLENGRLNVLYALQDIAEENGIARFSSVEILTVELSKACIPSFKWFNYVEEYYRIDGEYNALLKFLVTTDNFNL